MWKRLTLALVIVVAAAGGFIVGQALDDDDEPTTAPPALCPDREQEVAFVTEEDFRTRVFRRCEPADQVGLCGEGRVLVDFSGRGRICTDPSVIEGLDGQLVR